MVLEFLRHLSKGRDKPGNPLQRIIIGIKLPVYDLLKMEVAQKKRSTHSTAEHLIRLGIASEQELDHLQLLEDESPKNSVKIRGHLKERRYIFVNRRLHYLIKGYGLRHCMTVKTATEHLICLGIVAQDILNELESKDRSKAE